MENVSVSIRMSSTNFATSATAGLTPCCSASAWSAPRPSRTSGRSGSPKSAAAALSRPSSSWARSATCGRTSKCWLSWRGGGRGPCWRKTPEPCRKKSGRWRTSSARRWHKRIWRRCLMRPSLWGCGTLTGERGGRGRSAARPIRWRCSPSPGGRSTCASSREGGGNFPVTHAKTGTADVLLGTELDVRTIFTFTWVTPDVVARMTLIQWSIGSTEAKCACLPCCRFGIAKIPLLMPKRQRA